MLRSGGAPSHIPALAVAGLLGDGTYRTHLQRLRERLTERRNALVTTVRDTLGQDFTVALDLPGRRSLPPDGWDRMLIWAFDDHRRGRRTDLVSAVEVVIDPAHRGRGLSTLMRRAMADNARTEGFRGLVVPVRPTAKHEQPETPTEDYVRALGPDGLPRDPWLRTHVQLGSEVAGIAPASMTIPGSLEQWRTWTGLPFDESGPVIVPGALAPVHCSASAGYAVYVEPNVWIAHSLT
ncbi:N-acetyltransferase [Streptomyces sp. NPDC048172]|uniref:N-acetyltransferase n=1 Tax=Streptomyces sp. NPDC048172 TaxID=3365505 RepID=UPI0037173FC1